MRLIKYIFNIIKDWKDPIYRIEVDQSKIAVKRLNYLTKDEADRFIRYMTIHGYRDLKVDKISRNKLYRITIYYSKPFDRCASYIEEEYGLAGHIELCERYNEGYKIEKI